MERTSRKVSGYDASAPLPLHAGAASTETTSTIEDTRDRIVILPSLLNSVGSLQSRTSRQSRLRSHRPRTDTRLCHSPHATTRDEYEVHVPCPPPQHHELRRQARSH